MSEAKMEARIEAEKRTDTKIKGGLGRGHEEQGKQRL
jgi:hypothetical protein